MYRVFGLVHREPVIDAIVAAQPFFRAGDPKHSFLILDERGEILSAPDGFCLPALTVQAQEARVFCPHPEVAFAVFEDGIDVRRDSTVGEPVAVGVIALQPTRLGTNPEHPGSILVDRLNKVIPQAVRVIRVVAVDRKAVAVIAVQAILRANPKETPAILENVPDDIAG